MLPADFSARDDLSSDIPDIGPNNSSRAELSTADPIGLVTAVDGLEEPYVPFVSDVIGRRSALDSLPGRSIRGRGPGRDPRRRRDGGSGQPHPAREAGRARIRAEPGPRRPRGPDQPGGTGRPPARPGGRFRLAGRAGSVALERLSTHHRFAEGASAGRRGAPGDRQRHGDDRGARHGDHPGRAGQGDVPRLRRYPRDPHRPRTARSCDGGHRAGGARPGGGRSGHPPRGRSPTPG